MKKKSTVKEITPLVFNVHKPEGPSSFSIVNYFKKNLDYDFGKIGHFGTLDPFASGVLLVGVQGAQKINDYVHRLLPKTYQAVGVFGKKTKSGDQTTECIEEKELDEKWKLASVLELEEFLGPLFLGEYWQAPHSVSASKLFGKPLYRYAMKGKVIEKEKVKREVLDFKIHSYHYPHIEFSVKVSSGTYVRKLFEEMALALGGVGALMNLKRTHIGQLNLDEALRPEDWPKKGETFDLVKWGTPIDKLLPFHQLFLDDMQTKRYLQGHTLSLHSSLDILSMKKLKSGPTSEQNFFWVYNNNESEQMLLGLVEEKAGIFEVKFNLTLSIALFSSTI